MSGPCLAPDRVWRAITQSEPLNAWDPPRTFAFTWDSERIRFDLSPTPEGTRLVTVVHVIDPAERGWPSNAAGYHACLDPLEALGRRRIDIFEQAGIPQLEATYSERG